jgi:diguanylate cyclase (GGDEF)-like protein
LQFLHNRKLIDLNNGGTEQSISVKIRARKDLILIGIAVAIVCVVTLIDPDKVFEWLAQRREAQVDEFLVAVVAIGGGFAIFSWRRWVDLSRQVAEYKRLQKELSLLNQEASQLSETDDLLQSCLSSDEAFKVVIGHVESQLPGSSGAICTITGGRDLVEVVAQWGSPALANSLFPPEDCWGLRRGRVNIQRAGESKLICAHIDPIAPSYAMCVPMVAQGETVGVLCLDSGRNNAESSRSPLRLLSEAQERMVKTLAEHLALAVANLNLRETLRRQSIRDSLTDLYNRRYMEESLDRELLRSIRGGVPVAIMMVDVDHFKQFNDSFGHEAGDILLQELAQLFRAQLRAEDIACRYGGEEFTLILPELPLELAQERAEQLCRAIRMTDIQYRGKTLRRVTISVGLACYPRHGSTRDALLRAADTALYRAKDEGRDRVIVAW